MAALGGLTYASTAAGEGGASPNVVAIGTAGVAALIGFVMVEHRSTHPLVPLTMFRAKQFSAANLVTVFVYAALGVVFLLLVLHLQVVAGFSPLLAGAALLPFTVLMLLFSARVGTLAARTGPRAPLTIGPLLSAAGLLLMLRIGTDASYLLDVLPAVALFGVGLTITVAPLTATVLDSAPGNHAGVASGVNNALARAAGLLAVAAVPVVAGIAGDDYTDPIALAEGFRTAMLVCATLLIVGAIVAFALIRRPLDAIEDGVKVGAQDNLAPGTRLRMEQMAFCSISNPPAHPRIHEKQPVR